MTTANAQEPIESQTGPDDIIDTEIHNADAKKDALEEKLEGAEPSKAEDEVNPEDAQVSRSE
ncbi:hypothetical protein [Mucilaginibacter phyllosphaerae]